VRRWHATRRAWPGTGMVAGRVYRVGLWTATWGLWTVAAWWVHPVAGLVVAGIGTMATEATTRDRE